MSRGAGPSTKSILYCRPEQPPPITATRRAPSGRPWRVRSEVSFLPARSVILQSFSLPILYLISGVMKNSGGERRLGGVEGDVFRGDIVELREGANVLEFGTQRF